MTTRFVIIAAVVAAILSNLALAQPKNLNPSVTPLNGNNYGEWTAKWWEWTLSVPAPLNPNLEFTGVNCGVGQSGPVWFLPGYFPAANPPKFITRHCTVPFGKSLLIPLPNAVFGAGAGDCETPGIAPDPCNKFVFGDLKGVSGLHASAKAFIDSQDILHKVVTLDSVQIKNLAGYRAPSPPFSYTLPTDNVINAVFGSFGFADPPGKYEPAVSDGYWLLFEPLSPGQHTIVSGTDDPNAGTLTFILTILPK